tara:strand:+ start:7046 stop:8131 length:1086 start_codon:yes stop_codon:yes gene_type:complete
MGEHNKNCSVLAWPKQKNKARNPFQFLLYDAVTTISTTAVNEFSPTNILSLFKADILHIHWPDAFLAAGKGVKFWPRYLLLRLICMMAALSGTRIVWTAHNLQRDGQRNADRLSKYFWPWFLRRVDGIVFMTKASEESALQACPFLAKTPHVVIPHGHYGNVIAKYLPVTAQESDKPTALFFGSITPYKNAHALLAAFLSLPVRSAELRIKGKMSLTEPDKKLEAMLVALPVERQSDVIYENNFLSEKALITEIYTCDLVVFPYSDVLNSGAAIFALSVGRPILASNTSLFRELQQMVGEDWVYLIDGELDAHDLSEAMSKAKVLKENGGKPDLSKFEWDVIAQQTVDFYHQVMSKECNQS